MNVLAVMKDLLACNSDLSTSKRREETMSSKLQASLASCVTLTLDVTGSWPCCIQCSYL